MSGAVMSVIYKNGSYKDCNNNRGISVLSVVGKVYKTRSEKRTIDQDFRQCLGVKFKSSA